MAADCLLEKKYVIKLILMKKLIIKPFSFDLKHLLYNFFAI